MKRLIKLLCKIPAFNRAVMHYAFDVKYVDKEEFAKLEYRFSDSQGKKYYTWVKPDFIPITRWNEIETRLLEMNSRITRETLGEFVELTKAAFEKKDMFTAARLMGELDERVDMLYDPHALIRVICSLYVREDQIESSGVWNQLIEDAKFEQIKSDLQSGALLFFSLSQDLTNVLTFSDTSTGGLEIFEKSIMNNQIKQVEAFDNLIAKLKTEISKPVSQ